MVIGAVLVLQDEIEHLQRKLEISSLRSRSSSSSCRPRVQTLNKSNSALSEAKACTLDVHCCNQMAVRPEPCKMHHVVCFCCRSSCLLCHRSQGSSRQEISSKCLR